MKDIVPISRKFDLITVIDMVAVSALWSVVFVKEVALESKSAVFIRWGMAHPAGCRDHE
jgi:hypothetical protein